MHVFDNNLSHTFLKALRYLSFALLPALTAESHAANVLPRRTIGRAGVVNDVTRTPSRNLPYLAVIGPIPLRFATDPEISPYGPPAPPVIKKPEPDPVAKSPDVIPPTDSPVVATNSSATPADLSTPQATQQTITTTVTNTVSILPDDTNREVRPEDVLPFFQYPGTNDPASGTPINIVVPASPSPPKTNTQPPSSATYQLR